MYTILINDDNTLTKSVTERIMHRSTNVNTIQFLMNPVYTCRDGESMDMTEFTVTLEYVLPVSRTYKTVILEPEEELYKERLRYTFPLSTEFTSEVGEVELKFTMTKLNMLEDGTKVEYVRPTSSTCVNVLAVENWSDYIADSNLSTIAQIMLNVQARQEELNDSIAQLSSEQVADIKLDADNDNIHLVNNAGDKIGEGINTTELGDEIVEASNDGLVQIITI